LSVEAVELVSLAELDAIEPAWRELWSRDPRATPFQSPDWLLPWTRHLWGGGQIRVLSFWREGKLSALVPFFELGDRLAEPLFFRIGDYRLP
jgi:CelD/BcsL family acetyltransferase involved in cellulose biosynthesis